jgi:hypothetical protein
MARSEAFDRDGAIERLRTALAETGEATAAATGSGSTPVAGER